MNKNIKFINLTAKSHFQRMSSLLFFLQCQNWNRFPHSFCLCDLSLHRSDTLRRKNGPHTCRPTNRLFSTEKTIQWNWLVKLTLDVNVISIWTSIYIVRKFTVIQNSPIRQSLNRYSKTNPTFVINSYLLNWFLKLWGIIGNLFNHTLKAIFFFLSIRK